MPSSPYLSRRGRSWIVRVRVPDDLRPIFRRTEVKRSLGPICRGRAIRCALGAAAGAHDLFDHVRRMTPHDTARLDDKSVRHLVDRFIASSLEIDAVQRASHMENDRGLDLLTVAGATRPAELAMLERMRDDGDTAFVEGLVRDLLPVSPPLRVRVSSHCAPMGR